jgi:hypothetical protein
VGQVGSFGKEFESGASYPGETRPTCQRRASATSETGDACAYCDGGADRRLRWQRQEQHEEREHGQYEQLGVGVWERLFVGLAHRVGRAVTTKKHGKLGTITRSNGVKQVTYNGHPLYRYVKDGDAGDAYGEAIKSFGAEWYALAPSGKKVDLS